MILRHTQIASRQKINISDEDLPRRFIMTVAPNIKRRYCEELADEFSLQKKKIVRYFCRTSKIATMEKFEKQIEVRWGDLDPNFHMLHSKYYDLGAFCRMAFLTEHGLTPAVMIREHIGPILFREECIFKRELAFGDEVMINFKVAKLSVDYGRWTMTHEIFKNTDTLAALLTVEGAWMNTQTRRLCLPPVEVISVFETAPRTKDFVFFERTKR